MYDEEWEEYVRYEGDAVSVSQNKSSSKYEGTGEEQLQGGEGSSAISSGADSDQWAVNSSSNTTPRGGDTTAIGSRQQNVADVQKGNASECVVICPGRKRKLTTFSQWSRDARTRMLAELKYDHGVTQESSVDCAKLLVH